MQVHCCAGMHILFQEKKSYIWIITELILFGSIYVVKWAWPLFYSNTYGLSLMSCVHSNSSFAPFASNIHIAAAAWFSFPRIHIYSTLSDIDRSASRLSFSCINVYTAFPYIDRSAFVFHQIYKKKLKMIFEEELMDFKYQPGCRRSLTAFGIGVLGSIDFQ